MTSAEWELNKYKNIVYMLEECLNSSGSFETVQKLVQRLDEVIVPMIFPCMDGSNDGISDGDIARIYGEKAYALQTKLRNRIDYIGSYVPTALQKLQVARDRVNYYQGIVDDEAAQAEAEKNKSRWTREK